MDDNCGFEGGLNNDSIYLPRISDLNRKVALLSIQNQEMLDAFTGMMSIKFALKCIFRKIFKMRALDTVAYPEYDDKAVDRLKKYDELIYNVCSHFEGETRHETALRYIKNAEEINGSSQGMACVTEVKEEL